MNLRGELVSFKIAIVSHVFTTGPAQELEEYSRKTKQHFKNFLKKKFYYAQTVDFYRRKHPDLFAKQATIFRPAFFCHWKRLIRDPIHILGFIFMKVCEFSAGALGFLLTKMSQASCLFSHFVRK